MTKMHPEYGNWIVLASVLINHITNGGMKPFKRSELMKPTYVDYILWHLNFLGHKNNPDFPVNTLQNTINSMRKKMRWLESPRAGEYRVTEVGRIKIQEIKQFMEKSWYKKIMHGIGGSITDLNGQDAADSMQEAIGKQRAELRQGGGRKVGINATTLKQGLAGLSSDDRIKLTELLIKMGVKV